MSDSSLARAAHQIVAARPGHGAPSVQAYFDEPTNTVSYVVSDVAAQRAGNVHVHDGIDEDAFVAMREACDATLAEPRLILPSIQVNIHGGELPPPEASGKRYLRIPLDAL